MLRVYIVTKNKVVDAGITIKIGNNNLGIISLRDLCMPYSAIRDIKIKAVL